VASRLGRDREALDLARAAVAGCLRCRDEWESAVLIALRSGDRALAVRWLGGPAAKPFEDVALHLRVMVESTWQMEKEIEEVVGPRRVQLQAQRLATLGLLGRAHQTLRPHREPIVASSDAAAQGYALSAWRAGDEAEARRALSARGASAEQIEQRIAGWSLELGRRDAPVAREEGAFPATVAALLARGP
jgi:hypothetical protein